MSDDLIEKVARALVDATVEIGMNASEADGPILARAAIAAIEGSGTHVVVPVRLISAAPDMMEALDQLLDDMGEDGLSVCQAAKDQARAALAKAKGETE